VLVDGRFDRAPTKSYRTSVVASRVAA
jgi:hypothetical protein